MISAVGQIGLTVLSTYMRKSSKVRGPLIWPPEQPTKFELAVNSKAAKQIGLRIPQSILYPADKVIK